MMEKAFYFRRRAKMSLVADAGLFVVSLIAVGSSPIFPVAPFTIEGAMIGAGLWFLGSLYILSGSSTIAVSGTVFAIGAGTTGIFSTIALW